MRSRKARRAALQISPDRFRFATIRQDPFKAITQRLILAAFLIALVTAITYLGRSGYADANSSGPLTLIDSLYYSTVTITTTGYGDIVPATQGARLITTVVVTPIRVLFLVLLVGTTLEVLASRSRFLYRLRNWQKDLHDHVIVCGYGIKGQSALEYLRHGGRAEKAVAIDKSEAALESANSEGITGILGTAYEIGILKAAGIESAKTVIVSVGSDEQSVLTILRARELNPAAKIVASCREQTNIELLRSSGADEVVVSSSSAGRILGMAAQAPSAARVVNDLLTFGDGLDIDERDVTAFESGAADAPEVKEDDSDIVVAIVRDGEVLRRTDHRVGRLRPGDRVIYVRENRGTGPAADGDEDGTGAESGADVVSGSGSDSETGRPAA